MYLIKLGRDITLSTDTLVKGLAIAVTAFKEGWELDIINSFTDEIIVRLRDHEAPYFSANIYEIGLNKVLENLN